ncbi:MAG TPA: glycosyltransferase family 4 protein, partial [Candidatus Limnocylindria bacterium]|nr:glycosyltransferase family 4 protein [Candidatus Limnocylindria bacterium]
MPGSRLRILVVSAYPPSRTSGGRVRLRALMRELAERHDVSLLCYADGAERDAILADCASAELIASDRLAAGGRVKRAGQLRSLLSATTYERRVHLTAAFQAAIDRTLARERFDVVHVEGSQMAGFRYPPGTTVVLDEQNVEYDVLLRAAAVAGGLPRRLFTLVNAYKLRGEEQRAWRSVAACAVPSTRDEAIVRGAVPGALTAVVPNGVDLRFFEPRDHPRQARTILFLGQLGYYPNTDALRWFRSEIWPRVRGACPETRLIVVGPSAPPDIAEWSADGVHVAGAVPDVRPYLAAATAVVVPLRAGGGTRIKILEALAMRCPVVSTPLGAEGLDVTDGHDILLADGAPAFADA